MANVASALNSRTRSNYVKPPSKSFKRISDALKASGALSRIKLPPRAAKKSLLQVSGKTPRKWQTEAYDFLRDHLLSSVYAYICAPMGTGKSFLMLMAADGLAYQGTCVIVVGRAKIVKQHVASFERDGCTRQKGGNREFRALRTPSGRTIIVMTWQAAARMAYNKIGAVGLLIIDECHVGASNEQNKSIPSIMQMLNPTKRIYVSATLQNIKPKALVEPGGEPPLVRGSVYHYTVSAALKAGDLNPIDLCVVHSLGECFIRKIEALEEKYGTEVVEEAINGKSLMDLAKKMAVMGVRMDEKSIKAIRKALVISAVMLYLDRHFGEQAINFCPTIEAAEAGAKYFNARAKFGNVRAVAAHTQSPTFERDIERFQNGEITVIFVVGMLQEGFDMPSLRLGFDCRFYRTWTPATRAAFLQRLGRLLRLFPGKVTSLLYVFHSLLAFYDATALSARDDAPLLEDSPEALLESAAVLTGDIRLGGDGLDLAYETDIDERGNALVKVIKGTYEEHTLGSNWSMMHQGAPEADDDDPGFSNEPLETKKVKITRTPLYYFEDMESEYKIIQTIRHRDLFNTKRNLLAQILANIGSIHKPFRKGSDKYTAMVTGKHGGDPLYDQIIAIRPCLAIPDRPTKKQGELMTRLLEILAQPAGTYTEPFRFRPDGPGTPINKSYGAMAYAKKKNLQIYDDVTTKHPALALRDADRVVREIRANPKSFKGPLSKEVKRAMKRIKSLYPAEYAKLTRSNRGLTV